MLSTHFLQIYYSVDSCGRRKFCILSWSCRHNRILAVSPWPTGSRASQILLLSFYLGWSHSHFDDCREYSTFPKSRISRAHYFFGFTKKVSLTITSRHNLHFGTATRRTTKKEASVASPHQDSRNTLPQNINTRIFCDYCHRKYCMDTIERKPKGGGEITEHGVQKKWVFVYGARLFPVYQCRYIS